MQPVQKFELNKQIMKQQMISVLKSIGIIFCVVLFLPFIITVFWRGIDEAEKFPVLSGPEITVLSDKGTEKIPIDEYMCGILAQYYEIGYTREELKALSVILRTNLLYELEQNEHLYCEIWNKEIRREQWGNNFQIYELDLRNILWETTGEILLHNGKIEEITIIENLYDERSYLTILQHQYEDYVIYHYF